MVRKLTVVIGLAMSLLAAREARALPITITPVDLDSRVGGSIVRSHTALFTSSSTTPPSTTGEISGQVFFDGVAEYTYVHRVMPYVNVYFGDLNTRAAFYTNSSPRGFHGIAGWSFSDALRAGGTGTDSDFLLTWSEDPRDTGSTYLEWSHRLGWWDPFEPIQFFFVSDFVPHPSIPCGKSNPHCSVGLGTYYLNARDFGQATTQGGLAPVPEPGSIALLGSGLVGLYATMRRRRSPKG